jgi:hypothetical protein
MPVELVRGGMALGDAKGWAEDEADMVRGKPKVGGREAYSYSGTAARKAMTATVAQTGASVRLMGGLELQDAP